MFIGFRKKKKKGRKKKETTFTRFLVFAFRRDISHTLSRDPDRRYRDRNNEIPLLSRSGIVANLINRSLIYSFADLLRDTHRILFLHGRLVKIRREGYSACGKWKIAARRENSQ